MYRRYLVRPPFLLLMLCIAWLLLCVGPTSAEIVRLTTGEVVMGKITEQNDTTITMQHAMFGQITIVRDKIESITDPSAAEKQNTSIQLDAVTPAGRDISQAMEKAQAIEQEKAAAEIAEAETEAAADAPTQPEKAETPEKPKTEIARFLEAWSTGFEVGFNGSSGESNSLNIFAAINMNREDEASSDRFRFRYFFENKDGSSTRNNGDATWWHNWNLDESRWLYSLIGRMEADNFRSWDYRMTGNIGVGYRLSKDEPMEATVRAGIGATKEFGSVEERFDPEGSLGFELDWKINGWLSLDASATYLPKLADVEDYRALASLDWYIKIDDRLNLKLGLDNEYNSKVDPGSEKNDLKTYGAIVVQY